MVLRSDTASTTDTLVNHHCKPQSSFKKLFAFTKSSWPRATNVLPRRDAGDIKRSNSQATTEGTELAEKAFELTDPAKHPEEAKLQDAAALFFASTSTVPEDIPPLPKPAAVPRLHPGSTFPFARAWVPELENHGIEQQEWLAFLDHLNIISFPHPTVTIMELAALGMTCAPIDGADGISALLELLAMLTASAIVHARCKHFLNRANEAYFHPRKLHASVVSTPKLKTSLGLAKGDKLIAPLSEEVLKMSAQDRCLAQMRQHTCDLDFDVPDQIVQRLYEKALSKASRWRAKHKVKLRDKKARAARKRSWKKMQKGKEVKKEGWTESHDIRWLSWLLLQNLDEFEQQQRIIAEEKQRRKEMSKQRRASIMSLTLRRSQSHVDSKRESVAPEKV